MTGLFHDLKAKAAALFGYQDRTLVDVVFAKTMALDDAMLRALPSQAGLDRTILAVSYAAAHSPARPLWLPPGTSAGWVGWRRAPARSRCLRRSGRRLRR